MVDIEESISILPFIGCILTFLAFLTPAALNEAVYGGVILASKYVWIWGLEYFYYEGYANQFYFSTNPIIFYSSIICSIIIFIGTLVIFITICMVWKGTKNIVDIEKYWLNIAVLIIIIVIFWDIIMEFFYFGEVYNFWTYYFPGFGIIGIILGASLTLIGVGLKKKILKSKIMIFQN